MNKMEFPTTEEKKPEKINPEEIAEAEKVPEEEVNVELSPEQEMASDIVTQEFEMKGEHLKNKGPSRRLAGFMAMSALAGFLAMPVRAEAGKLRTMGRISEIIAGRGANQAIANNTEKQKDARDDYRAELRDLRQRDLEVRAGFKLISIDRRRAVIFERELGERAEYKIIDENYEQEVAQLRAEHRVRSMEERDVGMRKKLSDELNLKLAKLELERVMAKKKFFEEFKSDNPELSEYGEMKLKELDLHEEQANLTLQRGEANLSLQSTVDQLRDQKREIEYRHRTFRNVAKGVKGIDRAIQQHKKENERERKQQEREKIRQERLKNR